MNRFLMAPVLIAAALHLLAAAPAQAVERSFHAAGEGFNSNGSLFGGGIEARRLGHSNLIVFVDPFLLESGLFFPFGGSLTSASGDFLDFAFDEEEYYFDPATGTLFATVTFIGGTGRFQDVTGGADVMIVFDPSFRSFLFLIEGSIDY